MHRHAYVRLSVCLSVCVYDALHMQTRNLHDKPLCCYTHTRAHTHTNNNTNRNAIAAWSLDEKWIKKKTAPSSVYAAQLNFERTALIFVAHTNYTYCFLRIRFAVVGKYSILTPLVSAILKKQKLNDEQNMLLMNWNELEPTHTLKAGSVTRQAFR